MGKVLTYTCTVGAVEKGHTKDQTGVNILSSTVYVYVCVCVCTGRLTCTRLEFRYSAPTPRGWTRADTLCAGKEKEKEELSHDTKHIRNQLINTR